MVSVVGIAPLTFWSRVDQSAGLDACWPYTGAKSNKGYGVVRCPDGRGRSASRVALMLSSNTVSTPLHALHTCDHPICCNPAHLYWGTAKQNASDRKARTGGWDRGTDCHQFKDLVGYRVGRLIVVEHAGFTAPIASGTRRALWRCQCDCGEEVLKRTDRLRDTLSCGCLQRERSAESRRAYNAKRRAG